jgi:hypothetical protein
MWFTARGACSGLQQSQPCGTIVDFLCRKLNICLARHTRDQRIVGVRGAKIMTKRRWMLGLCVAAALGGASFLGFAAAQQNAIKDQLVGTWMLVSVVNEAVDGSKSEGFGSSPKGVIIFASDGHFSLFQSRAEIPRIAASDRTKATPEEAMAIVGSSIAYYGTFSVSDDKTILVKIDASTFANVAGGPEQKRLITVLTADELRFTNPRTPAGVTLHTVWKRAKPS